MDPSTSHSSSKPTALPHASSPPSCQDSYRGPPVSCGPRDPTSPGRPRPHVGYWESRYLTSPRKGCVPQSQAFGDLHCRRQTKPAGQVPVSVHQIHDHTRALSVPAPQRQAGSRLAPVDPCEAEMQGRSHPAASPGCGLPATTAPDWSPQPGLQASSCHPGSQDTPESGHPMHPRSRPTTGTPVPGPSWQNVATCVLVPQVLRKETTGSRWVEDTC